MSDEEKNEAVDEKIAELEARAIEEDKKIVDDTEPVTEAEDNEPNAVPDLPIEEQRYLQMMGALQKIVRDVNGWLQRAEAALHNHNLRINVLETIMTKSEFSEMRERLVCSAMVKAGVLDANEAVENGTKVDPLSIKDLQRVADEHVLPELKKRQEEMAKAAEAAAKKAQDESPIIDPNTGQPAQKEGQQGPRLVAVDGRPIQMAENDD